MGNINHRKKKCTYIPRVYIYMFICLSHYDLLKETVVNLEAPYEDYEGRHGLARLWGSRKGLSWFRVRAEGLKSLEGVI